MTDGEKESELFKNRLAYDLESHKAYLAFKEAMGTAAISYANSAFRALLILNGGAIIGILTFLGNLVSRQHEDVRHVEGYVLRSLSHKISYFIVGLILVVAAIMISYVSQVSFLEVRGRKLNLWLGNAPRFVACVLVLGSLVSFAVGAWGSIAALENLAQ